MNVVRHNYNTNLTIVAVYTFPKLRRVAILKGTENLISNVVKINLELHMQIYKVGNVKVLTGSKPFPNSNSSEDYYREIFYKNNLRYQEVIIHPKDSNSIAISQKYNLVFFVDYNEFSKSSAIYAVNYKTGKEVWRVRGLEGGAITGALGDMLAYNKEEKLLYIVEDIEGGRVDVWDLEQLKKLASKEVKDYPSLPYKYVNSSNSDNLSK